MSELDYPTTKDGEISLGRLINILIEYFQFLLRSWKIIGIITFTFILIFLIRAYLTPFTYQANLTFIINEDETNSLSSISSILGGFGVSGKGDHNLNRVLELSNTRRIAQSVLFEKHEINEETDFIANFIIDFYNYHEEWEDKKTELKDFKFTHDRIEEFDIIENLVLKILYSKIKGSKSEKGLLSSKAVEKSGIMTLSVESVSPDLSIAMVESYFSNLSSYYITKTVEKQQQTFDIIKIKVDSILNAINQTEYQIAAFNDQNRGVWSSKDKLKSIRLERNLKVLGLVYGEALKNLEIAEFTLKNKTPFIQEIDKPLPPLNPFYQPKLRAMVIGLFLGLFLAVVFLISRKVVVDALNHEKKIKN